MGALLARETLSEPGLEMDFIESRHDLSATIKNR